MTSSSYEVMHRLLREDPGSLARTLRTLGIPLPQPAAVCLPPGELLRRFFATWAAWDWREPVGAPAPPAVAGRAHDPTEPVRACTDQVGAGGRDLLTHELFRAWDTLETAAASGADPWPALLAPPVLHRRHAAWAVLTVPDSEHGRVRGRMRALLADLEEAGAPDAHAWPRPFATSRSSARYAIGLGTTPPDAHRLARIAEHRLRGLPGTTLTRAERGDVPTLR